MNDDISMSESLGSELTLDDDFCSDIPEEEEVDFSNSSGDFKHTIPSRSISELTENKIDDIVPGTAENNINNDNLQARGGQRQHKNCVFLVSPSKIRKKTPVKPKTSKWKEVDILQILNEHKLNNKAHHLVREYEDCSKALPGINNEILRINDVQSNIDLTTEALVIQNNEKPDLEILDTEFFLEEFDSKIKDLQKYLDDDDEILYVLQEKEDEDSNIKVFSSPSGENKTNVEYKIVIAGPEFDNSSSNNSPPGILASETDQISEKAEEKKNSNYLAKKLNLESKNARNKYPRMKGSESFDFHLSLSEMMISDSELTDRSTNRFMGIKRRSNQVSPRKAKNIVINYPSPHKHTSKVILNI